MAEQDPAERLAAALVEELHGDHGEALEAAAAAGALLERFGPQLEALRQTFARRFDEAALAGRDPLGAALQAFAGRFGPAEQVPLKQAAAAAPAVSDDPSASDDAARCARLRAALREARRRVRRLEAENQALREELLSAGEMIETLALDLERPIAD